MSLWITTVAPLLQKLHGPRTPFREDRLRQAFHLAEQLYEGKEHWTEVPLIVHALGVAQVLAPFEPDEDTVIACLLQHALETRKVTLSELEEQFGPVVRRIVAGIHLLSHVTMRGRRNSIEDLRVMLVSVSDDVRVILIILCERCYALEHLFLLPADDKKHLSRDVLNLFAPVAARLGIHSLKQRLESLAFPVVYPADAESIASQLSRLHQRRGSFLPDASVLLQGALAEQSIVAEVQGREKFPYSIFNKLRLKALSQAEQLPDLFGMRVLVKTEEECYRTLGLLHRMGTPMANRFKDYIAFPKPNGYRSLHTTVAKLPGVPDGVLVEVQVRTFAMHREAEFGIAAHWSYKEGGTSGQAMRRAQLHRVLTQQQALEEGDGLAPSLADHIFVLTPKGDIVELPEGATPLDFAFQIHTQLGLGFRAARVNGAIVPLDYQMENGDVVEVLTHRVPQPTLEWLQLLKMASSRSRLKRYLYSLHREEFVARGRTVLNDELRRLHLPPLDNDLAVLRRYDGKALTFSEREDVLMKLGQGSEKVGPVLTHLDALAGARLAQAPRRISRLPSVGQRVAVDGGMSMPVRYAKCCKPEAGERGEIVGSVTRRGEVIVHCASCRMLRHGNPERRIGVWWREEEPKEPKVAPRPVRQRGKALARAKK
ncbi:MAG: HD domain-containing protein [Candidatus Peribacteraceae bacterium]|nr:HD domain-containing protein [Candidatus Peribacteraceae bacterium]